MKIAILNNLYAPYQKGGAELSVEMLARGLVRHGDDVSVVTLHESDRITQEERDGVSVWRLPLRNIYWPFGDTKATQTERLRWHLSDIYNRTAARDINEVLSAISPDIVHTNNLSGFSVSAWKAAKHRKIPLVHTARDYYLLHPNSTLFTNGTIQNEAGFTARAWSLVKKLRSSHVAHFVGISQYVVDIHRRNGYFPTASTSVIFNSVEMPAAAPRSAFVAGTQPTYGYIGRLDPSKGLGVLLDAIRQFPTSRLLIAGSGNPEYVSHLKNSPPANVEFLGRKSPTDFFSMIDILIVPSTWAEPLGRVVLEAYAHGVPVVASRIGGLADVVWEGETGVQFELTSTHSSKSLSDGIKRIAAMDFPVMSRLCLKHAALFTIDAVSQSYQRVFQELVE
ncbi:glycosyltransferase family 4 protein [Solimonas marina]|uniref:Glycosyltransferase family 4 protein n=1 Tax=Solimonas marina TaxID=2714601 RepID=A0A970B5N2_9GAMM|nr:glycosyltransferase family 4 protein [Solimonas marina]NKF21893.1 glycosyltransferase family 4 protein [Solimonas marina]